MVQKRITMHKKIEDKLIQYKIDYKEMYIFRIAENKIAEGWVVADLNGLKEQLRKE